MAGCMEPKTKHCVRTVCPDISCCLVHTWVGPGNDVGHVGVKWGATWGSSPWIAVTSSSKGCGAPVCSSMPTVGNGPIDGCGAMEYVWNLICCYKELTQELVRELASAST
jgi:hypothetical protein